MSVKKVLHFAVGPVIAAGLSLITLPIIAWFFTMEDIGRLTMLHVSISLSVMLFSLAMHQAYVREYHEVDNKPALLKLVVFPGMVVLSVTVGISIIMPLSISNLIFGLDSSLVTLLLFLSVVFTFLINFLTHVLRMQERGLAFSATQITPKALLLILIGVIVLLNFNKGFINLVLANTIAIFASLVIFLWVTKDSWQPALKTKIDKVLLFKMLKFSLPLVAGGLSYWGVTTMDRFFIRALSGFEELAVYAIAISIAGVVTVLSTIFSSLWHPIVYKWIKAGVKPEKVQGVTESMLLVVVFLWSSAGSLSWLLLYLLPAEYGAVEYLIVAGVAMPIFYMLSETTVVGIGITRKSSYSMLASILAFITNAMLNYLLIPEYGASGAAIASVIAFFIFFVARTEASAYLWVSLPRIKMYFLLLAYVSATIIMVFTKAKIDYFFIIWLVLFVISLVLFSQRVRKSLAGLKNYKDWWV